MNKLLMIACVLLLAGCATDSSNLRGSKVSLTPAQSYVQAVEHAARRRGVQVYWMNRPEQDVPRMAKR